ncbi:MAG: hypothetical protein IKA83_06190 [Paludibacteraceae bacterium]|jgi:hypothetical protein|nr:hypothetical protein [Paludibacteraceae bacterium]MBR2430291.1 hypothetical protein [bacterium]
MSTNDFEYMKEAMAADLAELLSNDLELTIPEALDILYNSETYLKLSDPNTGLYFQSTLYVYSYLQQEISTGKIG